MRLGFVYTPVKDLNSALAFYRDTLGFEEAWREGAHTAGLKVDGTEVGILLDEDPKEGAAGPFFVIEDVTKFYDEHNKDLSFVITPREIPPGMYAAFTDPSGNIVRVMDNTKDNH